MTLVMYVSKLINDSKGKNYRGNDESKDKID